MRALTFSTILLLCPNGWAQEVSRLVWQPLMEYQLRGELSQIDTPDGGKLTINPFVSYTHIGTDFGFHGPGERYFGWENGIVHLDLRNQTDWAGMWHSLAGQARESGESLDFARPYGPAVKDEWQPQIISVMVRARGTGNLKLEIKSTGQTTVWERQLTLDSPDMRPQQIPLPTKELTNVKFLNWTAEPGSDIGIASISLGYQIPAMSFERYVMLASYAKLYRCYSPVTGLVKDRAHLSQGDFDSTPATGLFALATAALAHPSVGMLHDTAARQLVSRVHSTIRAVPKTAGFIPHFIKQINGTLNIHPGTEYSTVDTAIYLQSLLMAAQLLKDSGILEETRSLLQQLDLCPVLAPDHTIRHGIKDDGITPIPFTWRDWGGETALVMLTARMRDATVPLSGMTGQGRAWQGTGFITEIQSLLHPDFDSDQPDKISQVNWMAARQAMLAAQKAYFPQQAPKSFAARIGLYGLSAGEGRFGMSYEVGGVDLPHQSLIHPHYLLMAAALEPKPESVIQLLQRMEHSGLLCPLGVVENVTAERDRYLPMLGSLNAGFEALGSYHLYCKASKSPNQVYQASMEVPEIRQAMRLFY